MHTMGLTKHLVTMILVGIIAGTMMTTPHRGQRAAHGDIRFPGAIKDISAAQSAEQEPYAGAWLRMKSKTEAQIRNNDTAIRSITAQKAKSTGTFRAIYQKRIEELERRNTALKGTLNEYRVGHGERLVERR